MRSAPIALRAAIAAASAPSRTIAGRSNTLRHVIPEVVWISQDARSVLSETSLLRSHRWTVAAAALSSWLRCLCLAVCAVHRVEFAWSIALRGQARSVASGSLFPLRDGATAERSGAAWPRRQRTPRTDPAPVLCCARPLTAVLVSVCTVLWLCALC